MVAFFAAYTSSIQGLTRFMQARRRPPDCRPASSRSRSSFCPEVSSTAYKLHPMFKRYQVELPAENQST